MRILTPIRILAAIPLVLGLCPSGNAWAQCVPDPTQCSTNFDTVGRIYVCPDGLGPCPYSTLTVTVRNAAGNICVGSLVSVVVDPSCLSSSRVKFCNPVTLSGTTGLTGSVSINVAGGGCCKQPHAVKILASSIVIRDWNAVMSSDYNGTDNVGIPGRWTLTLTPVDLAAFIFSWGIDACHNYKNAGVTGPGELAVFVSCYKGGANFCLP